MIHVQVRSVTPTSLDVRTSNIKSSYFTPFVSETSDVLTQLQDKKMNKALS